MEGEKEARLFFFYVLAIPEMAKILAGTLLWHAMSSKGHSFLVVI